MDGDSGDAGEDEIFSSSIILIILRTCLWCCYRNTTAV